MYMYISFPSGTCPKAIVYSHKMFYVFLNYSVKYTWYQTQFIVINISKSLPEQDIILICDAVSTNSKAAKTSILK